MDECDVTVRYVKREDCHDSTTQFYRCFGTYNSSDKCYKCSKMIKCVMEKSFLKKDQIVNTTEIKAK